MKPVQFIAHRLMMRMLMGASAPVLVQTLTPLVPSLTWSDPCGIW